LDIFIEDEPKSKSIVIKDFITFNFYKKTNKKTIVGQCKKIWQQNTKDMGQVSRYAMIGVFSAAYIYSLVSLIVSVLVFVKSTVKNTYKLCRNTIYGFLQLSRKTLNLTFSVLHLMFIAPLFAIKLIQFVILLAYRKVKKCFRKLFRKVKKPTETEPKTKPTATSETSESNSTNRLHSVDNTETQKMLIIDHSIHNNAQTKLTSAPKEENKIKINNKDYNEALEDGDFVGIENDDAVSPPKNADEDFEYLCENSVAINYVEQIERLGDNKKYTEKLSQIIKQNESFNEPKNIRKIPVWNGVTIKNKNDEAARLGYLNAEINRSRIPRLCVAITKEHYYKDAYSLRYKRKVRTRAESPDPCCTLTGETDDVQYWHCRFDTPSKPRGRDPDFKYTAYHWFH